MDTPEGYVLVNDRSYVLKRGDRFSSHKHGRWSTVSDFAGRSIDYYLKDYGYKEFYVAIKGEEKPRFKTDKPYTFGY